MNSKIKIGFNNLEKNLQDLLIKNNEDRFDYNKINSCYEEYIRYSCTVNKEIAEKKKSIDIFSDNFDGDWSAIFQHIDDKGVISTEKIDINHYYNMMSIYFYVKSFFEIEIPEEEEDIRELI